MGCIMSQSRPKLSVIVPAHRAEAVLARSLPALMESTLPRSEWELIVVDDSSNDGTAVFAARFADAVVRLTGGPFGPAYARNRGVEICRGDIIVFIDSDVCVHPETLAAFRRTFEADGDIAAAFGSYDDHPSAPEWISQFRNLLHHWVHQRNAGDAETFWAGCGAVRRAPFVAIGMFDEWHYFAPEIEDIELGRRFRRAGHRILLRPDIQATHLKRWTLFGALSTDFRRRGVPWMRLLLSEDPASSHHSLNVQPVEKIFTALVCSGVLAIALSIFVGPGWPLAYGLAAIGTVVVYHRRFYRFLRRTGGGKLALFGIMLHIAYYVVNAFSVIAAWSLHHLFGEPTPPPIVIARASLELPSWPPVPKRPVMGVWGAPERDPTASSLS